MSEHVPAETTPGGDIPPRLAQVPQKTGSDLREKIVISTLITGIGAFIGPMMASHTAYNAGRAAAEAYAQLHPYPERKEEYDALLKTLAVPNLLAEAAVKNLDGVKANQKIDPIDIIETYTLAYAAHRAAFIQAGKTDVPLTKTPEEYAEQAAITAALNGDTTLRAGLDSRSEADRALVRTIIKTYGDAMHDAMEKNGIRMTQFHNETLTLQGDWKKEKNAAQHAEVAKKTDGDYWKWAGFGALGGLVVAYIILRAATRETNKTAPAR